MTKHITEANRQAIRADVDRQTHGSKPRLPQISGTGTTWGTAVGRGVKHNEKHCEQCGTWFTVPEDAFSKVTLPLMSLGKEIPCKWYCTTRQTRLNRAQDYVSKSICTKEQAVQYFIGELRLCNAPLPASGANGTGRLTKAEALEYYAKVMSATEPGLNIYRKVDLQDDLTICRKCYRANKRDKAAQHVNEAVIVRPKQGTERRIMVNQGKPLPEHLRGYGMAPVKSKSADKGEVRFWYCSTPSTRHEASFTIKSDKACTLKEAKEFFRRATGRATLAGCSITG